MEFLKEDSSLAHIAPECHVVNPWRLLAKKRIRIVQFRDEVLEASAKKIVSVLRVNHSSPRKKCR